MREEGDGRGKGAGDTAKKTFMMMTRVAHAGRGGRSGREGGRECDRVSGVKRTGSGREERCD